jgi:argininosuccinate lyase
MEGLIGDIPWGIGYSSEEFGLVSLDDSYVGLSSTSP